MPEILLPYTDVELTEEVNRIPNVFGLLNALNLAPNEPKGSKYVRIEYRDGQIYVLAATERGGPAEVGAGDTGNGIIIEIPHFPHLDKISVDDIDGVLEVVNGQVTPNSLDAELTRKLVRIRQKHSITREYIRLGMLKGLIKDGKGKTLYDIYNLFDIAKKTVDFTLGTEATDIVDKCEEVSDYVTTNLQGETMNAIEAVVSPTFFSKLIKHPKVEKFWIQAQNAALHTTIRRDRSGGNWGRVFEFGEIVFREYKGTMPIRASNGQMTNEANVAANKGHAFPVGTQEMFRTFDGPVYHLNRVNEPIDAGSEPVFISSEVLRHGEGIELKSQSNVLAVCKQPECQVELSTSN